MEEKDNSDYNWILILLVNGTANDLPKVLKNRNATSIKEFELFGKLLKNKK